ncbi:hypothetical protein P3T18_003095 [Paraburkholderia sp. GAS199]|uniref:hypothetical protein n=1 Tax=Paraburkholderia sp. GAS199 TaxID=3035126 RepID=UPI003D197F7A
MKLAQSLIVAAALAIPAVSSFAQANGVAAPSDLHGAQANVDSDNTSSTGVGGVTDGTSASGTHHLLRSFDTTLAHLGHKIQGSVRPDPNDGMKPVYFGS